MKQPEQFSAKFFISLCLLAGLFLSATPTLPGQSNLSIEGTGFFKNRDLSARLTFLHGVDAKTPVTLDAAILEDSAFLLLEQIKRDGFLKPSIIGRFKTADSIWHTYTWEHEYSIELEAGFTAEEAIFEVVPGVFYYYESVEFRGLHSMREKTAERFFIAGGALFQMKSAHVFTLANLNRRADRLRAALVEEGYRSASVEVAELEADESSGAVRVTIAVEEGPLYTLGDVLVVIKEPGHEDVTETRSIGSDGEVAFTQQWEERFLGKLRNKAFEEGFPDVRLSVSTEASRLLPEDRKLIDLRVTVDRGEFVRLGTVRFSGDQSVRESVLRRQTRLKTGEALRILEVSKGRRKLMALGAFEGVGLRLDPLEGTPRDVVYDLVPGERKELSLLAGWGSYEMARVGFKWEQRNPFGRAHRYEVDVKQSLRSSDASAQYITPQIFGSDLQAYLKSEFGFREEPSFDRTTRSIALGTSYFWTELGIRLAIEYRLAREEAELKQVSDFETTERATVGSLSMTASRDVRNSALNPNSGYNTYASYEVASRFIGGSVDFHRLEGGGSYHISISESTILHLGLRAGSIFSKSPSADNIPFNKRFFTGGENSVRGYREGGASPRDESRNEIGAEFYLLGNVELEQRIVGNFSSVIFVDGVANGRERLFDEDSALYSVGLGLRYNSLVGPIRLEYGHNLNPRPSDRSGTFHFSIGYPF